MCPKKRKRKAATTTINLSENGEKTLNSRKFLSAKVSVFKVLLKRKSKMSSANGADAHELTNGNLQFDSKEPSNDVRICLWYICTVNIPSLLNLPLMFSKMFKVIFKTFYMVMGQQKFEEKSNFKLGQKDISSMKRDL